MALLGTVPLLLGLNKLRTLWASDGAVELSVEQGDRVAGQRPGLQTLGVAND
jgi:hypothetical protein